MIVGHDLSHVLGVLLLPQNMKLLPLCYGIKPLHDLVIILM